MRITAPIALVALAALPGCHFFDKLYAPYYDDRQDPEISGLDVTTEAGNIGGRTVTINGSGFGDDPDQVVVLLGNHNAEVTSVTDSAITIKTPRGPITGGAVDLVVATATGYGEQEAAYTYDVTPPEVTGPVYDNETAYIMAQNMWTSCYGGMYDHAGDDLGSAGCEDIAYFGQTGLDGISEWFQFAYPRVQTPEIGWYTTTDFSPGQWTIEGTFDAPYASGVDNLKRRVGTFTLTNDLFSGTPVCIDPTLDPKDNEVDCDSSDPTQVAYDEGVVKYCEGRTADEGGNFVYTADWPVKHDFFQGSKDDVDGPYTPATVRLDVPDLVDGAKITVPGSMDVVASRGFGSDVAWALTGVDSCLDGNGDGAATLDEDGVTFSWTPVPADAGIGGDGVTAVGSFVHVSVTFLPIGWFGLIPGGPRASIVVADNNDYDESTGLASVSIPNSVLYQFPTPNASWSGVSNVTKSGTLGDYDSNASYMLVEVYRVTDYAIPAKDGGNVVFSYVTGDMTFLQDWDNPMERDKSCTDCLDDDGDGWVDALDPDCDKTVGGNGSAEDGTNSDFTCNDGIDNNGDGLADADDPLCAAGWNGETTCTDGIDNDGDGWIDALDAECDPDDPAANEDGNVIPGATCSDGIDNDGDGWIDSQDPGCTDGRAAESDGFSGTACNDGVDNDGHGDVDALDPYCAEQGGLADAEQPTFTSYCADGIDSETSSDKKDGFIDQFDPDCEYSPHTREFNDHFDPGTKPVIPTCYDGIDNDGDGSVDGDDPSCWNPAFDFSPDGFLNDEGASFGTGCTDGVDSDGDGWIDGEDPDCVAGSPANQEEVGFGTSVCNDGIDNNGDGKVDRESSYCKTATGTFEGP